MRVRSVWAPWGRKLGLWCVAMWWGAQLGMAQAATPLVAATEDHVLFQNADGQVHLWTTPTPRLTYPVLEAAGTRVPVPELSQLSAVPQAHLGGHAFAVQTAEGRFFVWGSAYLRDLWGSRELVNYTRPTAVERVQGYQAFARLRLPFTLMRPCNFPNEFNSCYVNGQLGLRSDKTVWLAGDEYESRGGFATLGPLEVTDLAGSVALAATGWGKALALREDGTVLQWGRVYQSPRAWQDLVRPQAVPGLQQVVALHGTEQEDMALAIDAQRRVWAWGNLWTLGLTDISPVEWSLHNTPLEITALAGTVQLTSQGRKLYALKADGTVWVAGERDAECAVGRGAEVLVRSDSGEVRYRLMQPGPIPGLSEVVAIAPHVNQSTGGGLIALKADGSLWYVGPYRFWAVEGSTPCAVESLPNQQPQRVRVVATPSQRVSPSAVTAQLVLSNDTPSPLTLSPYLMEAPGVQYLPNETQAAAARYGAIQADGRVRVDLPALTLAVGESRTLSVPLMVAQPGLALGSAPTRMDVVFGARSDVDEQTATLALDLSPREEPETPSPLMKRLVTGPVADLGAAGRTAAAQARAISTELPSVGGDYWNLWVLTTMAALPEDDEDRKFYRKLLVAGLGAREAYAVVYLRALTRLKPERAGRTQWFKLAQGSAQLWAEMQKARLGLTPDFQASAKTILEGLDSVNALYILNLLALSSRYSEPLVQAVQDNLTAFGSTYTGTTLALCKFMGGESLAGVPFARLVEANLAHYMTTRRWHAQLHQPLFSRVTLRGADGADLTMSAFLEDFMARYQTLNTGVPDCGSTSAQRHWVRVQVHSPLLPVLTDAQGRRLGVDAEGHLADGIPQSYIDPGHPWTLAVPATAGALQIDYQLAYPYAYGIDLQGLSDGVVTSEITTQGQADTGFTLSQSGQVQVDAQGGVRIALNATVSGSVRAEADRVFTWAESVLPQQLPAGAPSQSQWGYWLRHYPGTQTYLGVLETGGDVWYLGPLSPSTPLNLGPLRYWLDQARAAGY